MLSAPKDRWTSLLSQAMALLRGSGRPVDAAWCRLVPCFFLNGVTLPETNIAPEHRPSQKETSLQTIHFQVLC